MITIKSPKELLGFEDVCSLLGPIFNKLKEIIKPGISTYEIDKFVESSILSTGGRPNFKLVEGYHHASCVSVNDVLIHGIPSKSIIIKDGDIVSVDTGIIKDGFNSDACRTYPVGNISSVAKRLIDCTEECFYRALKVIRPGVHLYAISKAIQETADKYGYSLVREYSGHGLDKGESGMHGDPEIPNYYQEEMGQGVILKEGMVLAIEPMVMEGSHEIIIDDDSWGVRSKDHKLTCHYENDVVVTSNGAKIISVDDNVLNHLHHMEDINE